MAQQLSLIVKASFCGSIGVGPVQLTALKLWNFLSLQKRPTSGKGKRATRLLPRPCSFMCFSPQFLCCATTPCCRPIKAQRHGVQSERSAALREIQIQTFSSFLSSLLLNLSLCCCAVGDGNLCCCISKGWIAKGEACLGQCLSACYICRGRWVGLQVLKSQLFEVMLMTFRPGPKRL